MKLLLTVDEVARMLDAAETFMSKVICDHVISQTRIGHDVENIPGDDWGVAWPTEIWYFLDFVYTLHRYHYAKYVTPRQTTGRSEFDHRIADWLAAGFFYDQDQVRARGDLLWTGCNEIIELDQIKRVLKKGNPDTILRLAYTSRKSSWMWKKCASRRAQWPDLPANYSEWAQDQYGNPLWNPYRHISDADSDAPIKEEA